MLANDIAEKIKTLGLAGGPTVRVATLEPDVPVGVVVKTSLDGMKQTPDLRGLIKGPVQIVVRHSDPMTGDEIARAVMDALTVQGKPLDLDNYRITYSWPVNGEPVMYPVNDAGLFEFGVTFDMSVLFL